MIRTKALAWARLVTTEGAVSEEDVRHRMIDAIPEGHDAHTIAAAALALLAGATMAELDCDLDQTNAAIRAIIAAVDVQDNDLFAAICQDTTKNREQCTGLMLAMKDAALAFGEQNAGVTCASMTVAGICIAVNSLTIIGASREQAAAFVQSYLSLANSFESSSEILGLKNGKN